MMKPVQHTPAPPEAPAAGDFVFRLHDVALRLARKGLSHDDVALAATLAAFFPGTFAAVYDQAGRCLWLSPSFSSIANFPSTELLGRLLTEKFPKAWCRERLSIIRRAIDDNCVIATVEVFCGRRLESAVLPVPDARPEPMVVYLGRFGLALSPTSVVGHSVAAIGPMQPEMLVEAEWGPLGTLTRRELETLRLIARGLDNSQIAKAIHRTKRAVEWHISSLYRTFNCTQRTDLYRLGMAAGLSDIEDGHWKAMIASVHDGREHDQGHTQPGQRVDPMVE